MTVLPLSSPRLPRYMGSQRSQMDAIGQLVHNHVLAQDAALKKKHTKGTLCAIDACSGSGVASRWMRQQGWATLSNDQEPYAWYWNYYAMGATTEALLLENLRYCEQHHLPPETDIVAWWNTILPKLQATPYFEAYYAPNEHCNRMYFMPHVAHWLDQALHWHTSQDWSATPLLHAHFVSEVCSIMIRAANTSGTMKSFHSQWGGSTHHRIQDLEADPCIGALWILDGPVGMVEQHDATKWDCPAVDVIYFDPPSSVQQYSSSYHLLNAFVLGHYRIPSNDGKHGDKAGILNGATSSPFSRKASVERAWQDWVSMAQTKAPWLVVTYPKNGLISPEPLALLLQQNGRNTVSRHELNDLYVYTIKTNCWQSPQQLKRVFTKPCATPTLGEYYNLEKLSHRFSLVRAASKIKIYDNQQCLAIVSRRYKITWLVPPASLDVPAWLDAQLSPQERFAQYLVDRQWLSALTTLRDLRKLCRRKEYQEHWNMLLHLVQAHGQRALIHRVNAIHWR